MDLRFFDLLSGKIKLACPGASAAVHASLGAGIAGLETGPRSQLGSYLPECDALEVCVTLTSAPTLLLSYHPDRWGYARCHILWRPFTDTCIYATPHESCASETGALVFAGSVASVSTAPVHRKLVRLASGGSQLISSSPYSGET